MGILTRAAKELTKYYFPFTWRNKPSIESPINEAHLNHMEGGINEMDNRILLLAADKADKADLANVLINFEMSDTTGVMTFTRLSGEKLVRDTAMEKIALNCYLEGDNFVLELADGTKQTVSLAKFIDTYTFTGSDTIKMTVNGKNVAADIPDGKITLAKLEPTVISTIRQYTLDAQTAKGVAEQAASTAQGWAVGGTGFESSSAQYFAGQSKRYAVVTDEAPTDNAEHYCQEAKAAAERAGGAAGFDGTAASVSAVDIQGLIGAAGGTGNVQALVDAIAKKVAAELVSNSTLATQLAGYMAKANIVQVESTRADMVPSSAYLKSVRDALNSNLAGKANKSDLLNPYKTSLLEWRDYEDGTYTLINSILGRSIRISVGSNGRLSGTWLSSQVSDVRSIIIPNGIVNVEILSTNQVRITGTTAEYRVRDISAM